MAEVAPSILNMVLDASGPRTFSSLFSHFHLHSYVSHSSIPIAVMIRLRPTAISLTPSDVEDYDRRRWHEERAARRVARMEAKREKRDSAIDLDQGENPQGSWHGSVPSHSCSTTESERLRNRIFGLAGPSHNDCTPEERVAAKRRSIVDIHQSRIPIIESRLAAYRHRSSSDEFGSSAQPTEDRTGHTSTLPVSPENDSIDVQLPISPSKDDFHYGGFSETSPTQRSSSFAPEDASTPRLRLPDLPRSGPRASLPRSPLFMSQNASNSPERLVTSSLTPHVASRVATHNTPGMMFAQPARRPQGTVSNQTMRRPTRALRHQTNSFSFDSTERASAVYEQDRNPSSTTSILSEARNLREELRGSSLESSRNPSATNSASVTESSPVTDSGSGLLSSPSLPPPFSTTPRAISVTDISTVAGTTEGPTSSPPSSGGLMRSVGRFLSYRSRSPLRSPNHPSPSPSTQSTITGGTTPHLLPHTLDGSAPPHHTPSRSYRVYNDDLPATSQPQTPAHLPETRHQSRFHPSYTAPIPRATGRSGLAIRGSGERSIGGTLLNPAPTGRSRSRFIGMREGRQMNRAHSPAGLHTEGFRGLYGGRENGDDEANYLEWVQFEEAPRRLWNPREN